MKKLVVPLRRVIKAGSHGKDVVAVKRALRKAGIAKAKGPVTPLAGVFFTRNVKELQRRNHLKADGQYGEKTHKKLLRFFDAWGAHLMQSYHPQSPVRAQIVAAAMFAYHNCGPNYSQDAFLRCEGYYKRIKPPNEWRYADCSGFALWCLWNAGVTNCGPYDGWTGTMKDHGHAVSREAAKPGDMAFYGAAPDFHHVAVIVSVNPHMVVTHGHAPGPQYTSMDYRSDLSQIRAYA